MASSRPDGRRAAVETFGGVAGRVFLYISEVRRRWCVILFLSSIFISFTFTSYCSQSSTSDAVSFVLNRAVLESLRFTYPITRSYTIAIETLQLQDEVLPPSDRAFLREYRLGSSPDLHCQW